MRWTTQRHAVGSERIRTFFAWIPATIGAEPRWLERVTVREELTYFSAGGDSCERWVKVEFLEGE